jgi:predicted GIY-YIG superfamily endonuclease
MFSVYSIPFEPAFHHAKHYIGITKQTLKNRLKKHNSGTGARITAGAIKAGIRLECINLLGTFPTAFEAREAEKQIKKQLHHNKNWAHKICPVCYEREEHN